jgi:ATP-dependent Clp protease, protease subunit
MMYEELNIVMIAKRNGKTLKQVSEDTERDKFMNAEESLAYGLVDRIIAGKKK